jgi:hypothetical protein
MVALPSLFKPFTGMLGQKQPAPAHVPEAAPPAATLNPEAQALFALKSSLIEIARESAQGRGERPSLEDYRMACEQFSASDRGQKMAAAGQWKSAVYADLTGQNLSGFGISDPTGRTAKRSNNLDFMDRDGDGAISDFYTNISFNEANLKNCFVQPATSFNEEIARARNLEHMTFSGMTQGEQFTFGKGAHYQAIHLEQVNGGTIRFDGSVDGVTLNGTHANIAIGDHAKVSHIETAPGFSILHLEMGTGAVLADCNLRESTLSMTSSFAPGSAFQNVALSSNVNGLDLSGVSLNNVSIDGKAITHPSQLPEGVTYDARTTAKASPEFILQSTAQAALDAGVKNFSWNPEMQQQSTPEPMAQSPMQAATMTTRITGGESVDRGNIGNFGVPTEVATQVARIQPAIGEGMVPGMPGRNQA